MLREERAGVSKLSQGITLKLQTREARSPPGKRSDQEPAPIYLYARRHLIKGFLGHKRRRVTRRPRPLRRRFIRVLSSRRVLRVLNCAILICLITYVCSENSLKVPRSVQNLPYPMNIVREVRIGNLQYGPMELSGQTAGYSKRVPGTFRTQYPSITAQSNGTFDEIFVLTNEKCPKQFAYFARRAAIAGIQFTKVAITHSSQVSLSAPPIRLRDSKRSGDIEPHKLVSTLKRQIGYTFTHIRVWQAAKKRRRQRILVLDDTLFPKLKLLKLMPLMFNQVDQESVAGQLPWHYMFFRRTVVERNPPSHKQSQGHSEDIWSSLPEYGHQVVRAKSSYGVGMYALSSQGIDWLLEHLTEYAAPLDVQISLLQEQYPDEFVALSACNNVHPRKFCPEIVLETTLDNLKNNYECVWRRLQEMKVSQRLYPINERHQTLTGSIP